MFDSESAVAWSARGEQVLLVRRETNPDDLEGMIAAAGLGGAAGAQDEKKVPRSPDHHLPNETDPGPKNAAVEAQNPSAAWAVETDSGTVAPFKYPN